MNTDSLHPNRRQFTKLAALSCLSPVFANFVSAKDAEELPLFTEYGVCTRLGQFSTYKDAGYDYLEDATSSLLMPDKSDEQFGARLKQLRESKAKVLACNGFIPGSLRSVGEDANHEGVLNHADIVFKRANLAGLKGIVFGSSGSRKLKNGFKRDDAERQFVDLLKKMAPLAALQGIEVWLEPLNRKEDNFINTQAQGAAIIEKVNHPALGMVCDLFHVARNEESPEDLLKTVKYVRHCHIAEKEKRTAPSIKGDDFTGYFKALKQGKYSGSISMECGWDKNKDRPKLALEYLKKQVTSIQL